MIRRPTTHRATRRSGATLLEVLIGFGILGVAVTSIITLFPFSAITIANALKDDRGTTAAINGDGFIRDIHKRYVVEPPTLTPAQPIAEPYFWAMDNPAGVVGNGAVPGLPALSTTAMSPSYPVYVDPWGISALQGPMGDSGQALIPRVTFGYIATASPVSVQNTLSLRAGAQLDGLTYNSDGTVPGGFNMRELRYSIAWMLQRPCNSDRNTVRQQIIVYNGRPLYAPAGTEAAYSGSLTPGSTIVTINVGATPTAEIRKGTWILDAGNAAGGLLQAEFYRVVSVTDQTAGAPAGTYLLEVHKPVVRSDGSTAAYTGTLVVMPGVCDVFQRPSLNAGVGP